MEGIERTIEEKKVVLKIDSRVHSMNAVLAAAREFGRDFFVNVDGNPDDTLFVLITPKHGTLNAEQLIQNFEQMLSSFDKHELLFSA